MEAAREEEAEARVGWQEAEWAAVEVAMGTMSEAKAAEALVAAGGRMYLMRWHFHQSIW